MVFGDIILPQELTDSIMLWTRLMGPPDTNTHRQRLQALNQQFTQLFPKWDNDEIKFIPSHRWGKWGGQGVEPGWPRTTWYK